MPQNRNYVIVTPVRDEEQHIEATIDSVLRQTVLPAEWVLVDDGSSDTTGTIIDRVAAQVPWIQAVHRRDRGCRKAGGGVIDAFYAGYDALRSHDWKYIVKLDGDLRFAPDYFERCFGYFEKDPKLGIGGGDICHELAGELVVEKTPRFHVRGATKIYRRGCWEAIDGLWRAAGWDTIDEVKANMMGWQTYSFEDAPLTHLRFTGTAEGRLRDRVKHGVACYISGYHPLFVLASCIFRLPTRPYVVGSLATAYGFVKAHFVQPPRVDTKIVRYIRGQQLRRLFGLQTIWK